MHVREYSMMAVVAIAVTSLTACGSRGVGDLSFDRTTVDAHYHLFGDTAKPSAHIQMDMAYVRSSTPEDMGERLNAILLRLSVGSRYSSLSPEEATQAYADTYGTEYRTDMEPTYTAQVEEGEEIVDHWYDYEEEMESSVELYRRNLLVYRTYSYEYTGGTHGIYQTGYYNIDLRTMHIVTLSDLFVDDYADALTELLWGQLMDDNHVSTRGALEEMGYAAGGDLAPMQNFRLTTEGITFHYNVYEVAPYVMGAVQIKLSWAKLNDLIDDTTGIIESVK